MKLTPYEAPLRIVLADVGAVKHNFRTQRILPFLNSTVSYKGTLDSKCGSLSYDVGADRPIDTCDLIANVHKALIYADMDIVAGVGCTVAGIIIAVANKHAVPDGEYVYRHARDPRIGLTMSVKGGKVVLRESRQAMLPKANVGIDTVFAADVLSRDDYESYMAVHAKTLADVSVELLHASDNMSVTDSVDMVGESMSAAKRASYAHTLIQAADSIESLLDKLRELYPLDDSKAESLWDTVVLEAQDTPRDMAILSDAIAKRKIRSAEDETVSLRRLIHVLKNG